MNSWKALGFIVAGVELGERRGVMLMSRGQGVERWLWWWWCIVQWSEVARSEKNDGIWSALVRECVNITTEKGTWQDSQAAGCGLRYPTRLRPLRWPQWGTPTRILRVCTLVVYDWVSVYMSVLLKINLQHLWCGIDCQSTLKSISKHNIQYARIQY